MDELESIKEEIKLLRGIVESLTARIDRLTELLETNINSPAVLNNDASKFGTFNINQTVSRYNFQNFLYNEMLNIVSKADTSGTGVTAEEVAKIWGRSRSRTSEMLNQLVRKGLLIKYQDGRSIKFKTIKKGSDHMDEF